MRFTQTEKQDEHWKLIKNHNYIMAYGGGRSGKTINTLVFMIMRALTYPNSRQAIFRSTLKSCRETIFDLSFPEAIRLIDDKLLAKLDINKSELTATFPNGSVILFSGVDENRLENVLGQEFCTIYMNECSQIHSYSIIQTLMTRLSQRVTNARGEVASVKMLFDMNPPSKSHWSYRAFVECVNPIDRKAWSNAAEWAAILINPRDNTANLPAGYVETLERSLDVKARSRMIDGQFSTEVEGALFKSEWIAENRIHHIDHTTLTKIVVAVDPAISSGSASDETGIIVAGIDENDHLYVLADRSMRGTPLQWASEVARAYEDYAADEVIAESNQGGEMVKTTLRQANAFLPVRLVHASRGKVIRAEPVSQAYEANRVSHVGDFERLEEQLESFTHDYNRSKQGSPDRLDALVWAIWALAVKNSKPATMQIAAIQGF